MTGALTTRVLRGPEVLDWLADGYDALARLVDAPLTARGPWLATWARTHARWRPLGVAVLDGDDLRAAALLAHRRVGPLVDVAALGHGQSDYARFPALDDAAAAALADATVRAIRRLGPLRRLRLDGLPHADPVAARVVGALGGSVVASEGAPWVPVVAGVDPAAAGGKKARTVVRHGYNRLDADGRAATAETVTDPAGVAALLPELEGVHRARDEALRGRTEMDDADDRAFWYAITTGAAGDGALVASVLRVDGEIAAYALSFRDGPALRVWELRMNPEFARYGPGHLLRAELLGFVAADGSVTALDWMRGEERYKTLTTSEIAPLDQALAWSPAALGAVEPSVRRLVGKAR